MSVDLDRELRAALRVLVDAQPPTEVAARAIRRATRRRRAVQAGIAGVALAVAGIVTVPLLRPAGQTPPADAKPYTPSHVVLVFGNSLGDASYVLNPATAEYDRYPYDTVIPTADIKRLLIVDRHGDGPGANNSRRIGILDRASGDARWIDQGRGQFRGPDFSTLVSAHWSPDESAVLLVTESGSWLVDAETLMPRPVSVPEGMGAVGSVAGCFTPDGLGFQQVRTLPGTGTPELVAIERFSLDIAGDQPDEDDGWSSTIGFLPVENAATVVCSDDGTQFFASLSRGDGTYDMAIISATDGSVWTVPVGRDGAVVHSDSEIVVLSDGSVLDHSGRVVGRLPFSPAYLLSFEPRTIGPASAIPGLPGSLIF